jgi:hypothetical protein
MFPRPIVVMFTTALGGFGGMVLVVGADSAARRHSHCFVKPS